MLFFVKIEEAFFLGLNESFSAPIWGVVFHPRKNVSSILTKSNTPLTQQFWVCIISDLFHWIQFDLFWIKGHEVTQLFKFGLENEETKISF